jgi:phage terminase large subunit-like protein
VSPDRVTVVEHRGRRLRHELEQLTSEEYSEFVHALSPREALAFEWDWEGVWARDDQLLPAGQFSTWLLMGGRGFGKTRAGAEAVRQLIAHAREPGRVAFIGPTAADVRDVMVEGVTGILAVSPPWFRPKYEPSKRRLTWPNGWVGGLFSAEEPDRLRGPQHHLAWCEEVGAWESGGAKRSGLETWDMMRLGLRLGRAPLAIAGTTPKPTDLMRKLLKTPRTLVTRGSTWANAANLSEDYLADMRTAFAGTRLGRQELEAELLEALEGVLFSQADVDAARLQAVDRSTLQRVVVAVDPAPTSTEGSDFTGIVVLGAVRRPGRDGVDLFVLEDASCQGKPNDWAGEVCRTFHRWMADLVVGEINAGGEMVESTVRTIEPNIPFKAVRARRGKHKRAEPIAALYQQKRVHHVGQLPELEKQMRTFTGQHHRRDDRVDALVHGAHELAFSPGFLFV